MSDVHIDNGLSNEISEIRKDLRRNNVRRALNRLSDLVEAQGRSCSKEVRTISILLMQDYARVELWQIGDRVPPDEIARIVRNISSRALELCDAMEGDPAQVNFTPPDRLVDDAVGSSADGPLLTGGTPSTSQPKPTFDGEAVIDARSISRNFGASKFQLEPLDLKVMPGRILGIIGMNGSGKSTLLDILRGESAPDTGQVSYPALSRDTGNWTEVKRQIGFVAQRSPPWFGMVLSNLEYAAAVHGIKGEDNVEWTNRLLARYGLTLYKDRRWSELSAGFRMRFDLALARVNKPKLLILDEPLGNLDPVSQQSILFDIVQLARSTNTAIIITSQHLYETEAVADEILLLAGGKRIVSYQPRSATYFEIYWPKDVDVVVQEERIQTALQEFQPTEVKVGTTLCLIGLATRPTLADVVAKARERGLEFIYARDVTTSARIDMEHAVTTPVSHG
jgi:ABC-2 type transport system ATP-binding protein